MYSILTKCSRLMLWKAKLAEKTAVITGASRGIGRAIALKLADDGFNILVNYMSNDEAASKVKDEIKSLGKVGCETFKADVASKEVAGKLIDYAVQSFGSVDVLVNNAGITRDSLLVRMSENDWDDVINTNLKGAFNCLQAAAKIMMKQRYGRILNMSSVIGLKGNMGQANYAAAKSGLFGLTYTASKELAARNITVNAIAPGFIETDMTQKLSEKNIEKVLELIPLKRLGLPGDVAELAAFLVSDKASYITGQVIGIDGGLIL